MEKKLTAVFYGSNIPPCFQSRPNSSSFSAVQSNEEVERVSPITQLVVCVCV